MTSAIWPLFDLAVSTPRVSLRYVTDDLGAQLADLAAQGIHDPSTMPFAKPWTDIAPPRLQRNALRSFWRSRAETAPEHWTINLAAHDQDGQVVGQCALHADKFLTTLTASTGSWLGRHHQGRGLGREMRHAALHLLFAGLNAERSLTDAWHDNAASLRITRSLPYTEDAQTKAPRRDLPDTLLTFSMTQDSWQAIRRNDIELGGIERARDFLGITRQEELDSYLIGGLVSHRVFRICVYCTE